MGYGNRQNGVRTEVGVWSNAFVMGRVRLGCGECEIVVWIIRGVSRWPCAWCANHKVSVELSQSRGTCVGWARKVRSSWGSNENGVKKK